MGQATCARMISVKGREGRVVVTNFKAIGETIDELFLLNTGVTIEEGGEVR